MTQLQDIQNRQDIERLVKTFYATATADPILAPHFQHVDWQHHFPRMIDFWAFILLDQTGFTGNVFDAHQRLDINHTHFQQWITHFNQTVDTLFSGEKAHLAKQRAESIATIFQHKLAFIKNKT